MDEVNLLDDGLVDVVLDSSASGVNTVEREGVGIQHPAKFIMIGSGNPQVNLRIADRSVSCMHDACTQSFTLSVHHKCALLAAPSGL